MATKKAPVTTFKQQQQLYRSESKSSSFLVEVDISKQEGSYEFSKYGIE